MLTAQYNSVKPKLKATQNENVLASDYISLMHLAAASK